MGFDRYLTVKVPCIGETYIDKTYSMPKSFVSYRKPRKLSDEVVARKRDQMKNMKKNNR